MPNPLLRIPAVADATVPIQYLLESTPNAMVLVDESGSIVLINTRAESLFGYAKGELLGKTVAMLVPSRSRDAHAGLLSGFFRSPEARSMGVGRELFGLRKDGVEIPVEIHLNPVRIQGGRFVMAGILDIAERKKVEAGLKRSNEELRQFASIASHDLQEPLRAIATYAAILEEEHATSLTGEARDHLASMSAAARRLQEMIRSLLTYARLDRQELSFSRVPLEEAVREAIANLEVPIREGGAEVVCGALPQVRGDRTLLVQVFQNLLSNAIKFRGPDAPRIEVRALDPEADGCRIAVLDNGIGIETGQEERIFQMFQRLHATGKYPGSGVGLAAVRKIMERHGGTVVARPVPGKGTAFELRFPMGA